MFENLKKAWKNNPLPLIILIGFIARLLAAIFSKGYGMHDDHFGPIEQSFRMLNDYSLWTEGKIYMAPSLLYSGLHFILFKILNTIGIIDPQEKMYVVRILHALYSLLTVYFGYKLTEEISDRETARKAGLVLALFWFLPYMSVRNLIEMVCIPPMIAGFYYFFRKKELRYRYFIVGALFALSFVIRYQTSIIIGCMGIILLFRKQWKALIYLTTGFIISAFIFEGWAEWLAYGRPFDCFIGYFKYNSAHYYDYTTGPWYNYILLFSGIFLPPFSLLLIYGIYKSFRKYYMLLLPVLLFIIFHSIYPNKQERFVLPVIPLLIIIGIAGLEKFVINSEYWQKHKKFLKSSWIYFWTINSILLVIFTFSYSKKTRVEAMYYLSARQEVNGIVILGGKLGQIEPPLFYLNKYGTPLYKLSNDFMDYERKSPYEHKSANYAVLYGMDELEQRKAKFESTFNLKLIPITVIEPSFTDDLLFRLNPKGNKNQAGYIYKIIPD